MKTNYRGKEMTTKWIQLTLTFLPYTTIHVSHGGEIQRKCTLFVSDEKLTLPYTCTCIWEAVYSLLVAMLISHDALQIHFEFSAVK